MTGFNDMTYCTYYATCDVAGGCERPFTAEVEEAAAEWWGGWDFPISLFASKPDCWKGESGESEEVR